MQIERTVRIEPSAHLIGVPPDEDEEFLEFAVVDELMERLDVLAPSGCTAMTQRSTTVSVFRSSPKFATLWTLRLVPCGAM
ncbi:hypothetical protein ASD56_08940 [Microbacterium sp. Root166]|nr:hypothetical protein ASD56_08940 [Microbacterium sp. Root166]